jgi:Mitochondrial ATPase inhibitor, IATP.
MYSAGERGSGAGRGGGAGGAIRESGGKMGEMGAAKEEEYFYKKVRDRIGLLRNNPILAYYY